MRKDLSFQKTAMARAISIAIMPILAIPAQQVLAQDIAILEEVIVTASRREQSVQDIPINITSISNEFIEEQRLFGINEIARYVPGLTVLDRGPRNENPDIVIRGLNTTSNGPGFESDAVAAYFGDIPLESDIRPVDLERIEVLKGPQGTLYGKGTMAGAIRYIPKKADLSEFSVSARGGVSSMKKSGGIGSDVGVTLNFPIVEDTLAIRANVDRGHEPGFIDYNFVVKEAGVSNPDNPADLRQVKDANGADYLSARINLRWTPTEWLDANIWYNYNDTEAEGRQIAHQLTSGTGPYESALRYEEPNDYTDKLFAIDVKAQIGDFAEATFVYGKTKYEELGQRDQTDLLVNFEYSYEFFPSFSSFTREAGEEDTETIEIRVVSTHEGPVSWVVGYFQNELTSDFISEEFTPGFDQFAIDNFGGVQLRPDSLEYIQLTFGDEKETAFYGEISYRFMDKLQVTAGYRDYDFDVNNTGGFGLPLFETVYFGEPQDSINVDLGTNVGSASGDLLKLNVSYDVDDDNMVYATYSEGYRNGGVNSVPECTPEQLASEQQQLCATSDEVFVDPDTIKNYEIGYKAALLDHTLRLDVALYFIDWSDIQVSTTTANGSLPITGNGSSAESKGLELSANYLINQDWRASFNYAYTRAKLTERAPGLVGPFDALSGSRLPGHAEHQVGFNLTYSTQILNGYDLDVNYGLVYSSNIYNGVGGPEDTLVDADNDDAPADRGLEALPSYNIHHLSATVSRGAWSATAYVDNLFDEYVITSTRTSRRFLQDEQTGPGNIVGLFGLRTYGQYVGNPRNFGLKVTYDF